MPLVYYNMYMGADIIYSLIIFISTLISVSILGLVVGFSPTLYIAQIAIATKSKRHISYAVSLMSGVLVAVLLLVVLFQSIHLDTLLQFIDTTVRAVTLSVVLNMLVGVVFIGVGIWYLRHQEVVKPRPSKAKRATGFISLFGAGFVRTFISISGVTAAYLGGNIIGNISASFLERVIYTLVFFAATIIPFIGIIIYMNRSPKKLLALTDKIQSTLHRFNYRLIVGAGAVILGCSIVVFNLAMALFY